MRAMKDSGIAWIGEIPEGWEVDILSLHFEEHKQKNIGLQERNLFSLSYGKIIRKDINSIGGLLPNSFENYNVIGKDDIVFRLTDLQNDKRSLRTGLCQENGIITSAYVTLRKRENEYSPYFHYLFHSYDECKVFYGLGDGVRQGMNFEDLRKMPILVPPLAEQRGIAAFLDNKCAEVDELLNVQEQFIEELKNYKQALITETVTKGLHHHTKTKQSGIEWIGEIPEGWEVERLKKHILFINGYAFNSDEFSQDEGIRVIRIGDIGASIDYTGCVHSTENCANLAQYRIQENDILIAMSGATTGKTCIASNIPEAYINQRVGIIRTSYYRYIKYVLQAAYIPEYISLNNAGSAQPNISSTGIGNIPLPVPPLAEQEEIAAYLDQKCAEIDQLIAIKQQKAEELREYRKSLIYEYVTGKKQL